MKAGALILSFLFIVLTIEPAFIKWSNVSCAKEPASAKILTKTGCKKTAAKSCSSTKNKQQLPQKQPGEDPCNTCNPFMVCNGCAYMQGESQGLVPPGSNNPENTKWLIDEDVSSFPSDAWHPPELFMRL